MGVTSDRGLDLCGTPPPGHTERGSVPALVAEGITVRFGGLVAVDGVTVEVPDQTVVSVIGPNGAGKTTFFNALTGLYPLAAGSITLGTRDITGLPPHAVASAGVSRTFQNIRLFKTMTSEENVIVAMHSHLRAGILSTILGTPKQRTEERYARRRAARLLDIVGLGEQAGQRASELSYGDQRRLEIARALGLAPRVLLLDEPTAGMNPAESLEFTGFIQRLRARVSLSILLIEHDMTVVRRVSDRVVVLDRGLRIAQGTPDEIRDDPRVIEAYLGTRGGDSDG